MNIIFLDIDGVLNADSPSSKSYCDNYAGIDTDKTRQLARIVQETNAKIVLISSWKINWKPPPAPFKNYPNTPKHSRYLNNNLQKKGKLSCIDATKERNLELRGKGIQDWLSTHPEVENWVVLDDEIFRDYEKCQIFPHLVLTDHRYGLTKSCADAAIKILRNQDIGPYNLPPYMKGEYYGN